MTKARTSRRWRNAAARISLVASALFTFAGAAQDDVPIIAVGGIESSHRSVALATQSAIESSLSAFRKFSVMRHKRFAALLDERGLSVADVANGNASLVGLSGVDYLVTGRVVEAKITSKLLPLGSMLSVLGSGGECRAVVGVDARAVQMRSGEITSMDTVSRDQSVKVKYPPGADYADPCRYADRSQKWRALEAASGAVATEIARNVALTLVPIRLLRVSQGQASLNYGDSLLAVGDYLRVVPAGVVHANRNDLHQDDAEAVGYLSISTVGSTNSMAEIAYAKRPLKVGDVAVFLATKERRNVDKMLSDIARDRAQQDRECEAAREKMRRYCGRDADSRRCRNAELAVAVKCDA